MVNAVAQEPVAHLAGDLGHQLADAGEEDARHPEAVEVARRRREERRHQRVRVELAAELQRRPGEPRVPDRPDGEDQLAHPRRRVAPRHREALRDVRLDLAAEAEDEAALGERLQVPRQVGERHRVAGEGDGDRRAQLELRRVLGGEQQRQERVVARLGGPRARVPGALQLRRLLARPVQLAPMPPSTFMAATYAQPSERAEEGGGRVGPRRQCRAATPCCGCEPSPPLVVVRQTAEHVAERGDVAGRHEAALDAVGDQVRQVPGSPADGRQPGEQRFGEDGPVGLDVGRQHEHVGSGVEAGDRLAVDRTVHDDAVARGEERRGHGGCRRGRCRRARRGAG